MHFLQNLTELSYQDISENSIFDLNLSLLVFLNYYLISASCFYAFVSYLLICTVAEYSTCRYLSIISKSNVKLLK